MSGDIQTLPGALSVQIIPAGQIIGTTTNDNAAAGRLGEFQNQNLPSGSSIALTTATPANVISINTLSSGDWDVWGVVNFNPAGTTSITQWLVGISTTSATFGPQTGGGGVSTDPTNIFSTPAIVPVLAFTQPSPLVRVSLAVPTQVFLVVQAAFTVAALNAWGSISARRVR
jgi:hypothetical protein